MKNLYCDSKDLSNEASVESFFVLRLLQDLGYADSEIRTKRAVGELKVPKGRKRENFKPDFMLVCSRRPRWLLDAKSTSEKVEDWTYQCAGYSLLVNRKYKREAPLRYYMVTTGLLTRVYAWDKEEALLSLRFQDFKRNNPKYKALRKMLAADVVREGWDETDGGAVGGHLLHRSSIEEVKRAFIRCHRAIWKSEKMNPQAAFVGFAKLLFVKLWEDRRLRDDEEMLARLSAGEALPADSVRFSTSWIEKQSSHTTNPIDTILFRQLVEQLEREIAQKRRKRIFPQEERLGLSPSTVKTVVSNLENYYLFGIDEDLNGRMFEAFLTATMRGQDLGQYFTPRSIVKLMVYLAQAHAGTDYVERVLDACCGTGGFLIEVLTEMRKQVYDNTSLTKPRREKLLNEIANEAIVGVDAGREPPLAQIARINMYLHGDGGSRIYRADALRQPTSCSPNETVEVQEEVAELSQILGDGGCFDVVLTNPPFSMDYSESVPDEKDVLDAFEIAEYGQEGKRRKALRSAVLFLERYRNLLAPGGRLLTVIDDSILGSKQWGFVRDYLRENFIIRGVVSLHGDAFQRSGARVKTSVLYLVRRSEDDQEQPSAFVWESRYIGQDDVVPRTPPSEAAEAREAAIGEIKEILAAFAAFERGEEGPWLVPGNRLIGRLDAKFLRPWSVTELAPQWKRVGARMVPLADLIEPITEPVEIVPTKRYTFLKVTYSGRAEAGESRLGSEIGYSVVCRARPGDIVVSHINAVNKAICVISEKEMAYLISNEFTVLRLRPKVKADPYYLWSIFRSAAIVAEFLSSASGSGRHRVDWSILERQQVPVLYPGKQKKVGDRFRRVLEYEAAIEMERIEAEKAIAALDLNGEVAKDRLARAKPPK
ncbi:MAG: N-6 DNA methylase [Planctomycetota bacterium]|jgi:type I restriction enzyme M protein